MKGMICTKADIKLNILLNIILCVPHIHRFSNVVARKPLFPRHPEIQVFGLLKNGNVGIFLFEKL
jgi:hypothetical protein